MGILIFVGLPMIVEIDEKGRILIPKEIRKRLNIKKGTKLRVYVDGDKIVLFKEESITERYAGKYRAKIPIPEDLDEFLNTVIKEWWKENT